MQQNDNNDNVRSRLYDSEDDEFVEHFAGWNDQVEYDEDGEEEDENRRVVTIARYFSFTIIFLLQFNFAKGKVLAKGLHA